MINYDMQRIIKTQIKINFPYLIKPSIAYKNNAHGKEYSNTRTHLHIMTMNMESSHNDWYT